MELFDVAGEDRLNRSAEFPGKKRHAELKFALPGVRSSRKKRHAELKEGAPRGMEFPGKKDMPN